MNEIAVTDEDRELRAFSSVDFDWTRQLQSVWQDRDYHVEAFNKSLLDTLRDDFFRLTKDRESTPIGRVVSGVAGAGKTHLVSSLRREVWNRQGWFILLDMVDVKDFWGATCLAFVSSLHRKMPDGLQQYQAITRKLADFLGMEPEVENLLKIMLENKAPIDREIIGLLIDMLAQVDRGNTHRHQDVFRAFFLLNSSDFSAAAIGYHWLQGEEIDEEAARLYGFSARRGNASEIVRGLTWIMGFTGPTLIAVDQVDSIIQESHERSDYSKVETLAHGLMELHDVKHRAMTLVACVEASWEIIREHAITSAVHRFHEKDTLKPISKAAIARVIIQNRLGPAYEAAGFVAAYPTWPFQSEAFSFAMGQSPREFLIECEKHRKKCLKDGRVTELVSFDVTGETVTAAPVEEVHDLSPDFAQACASSDIEPFFNPHNEDEAFSDLVYDVLRVCARQLVLPENVKPSVDSEMKQQRPPLHGRLRLIHMDENDREEHFCLRAINLDNAHRFSDTPESGHDRIGH